MCGWAGEEINIQASLQELIYEPDHPIFLQIQIRRNVASSGVFSVWIAEDLYYHLDIALESLGGGKVFETIPYLRWKLQQEKSPVEPQRKKVEMGPGDTHIIQVDLRRFFEISITGAYRLTGNFFISVPEEYGVLQTRSISLGELFFDYENSPLRKYVTEAEQQKATDQQYPENPITVVKSFLDSQNKKNWKNHFSLIRLEDFLTNSYYSTEVFERYISAMEGEKGFVVQDFKDYLMDNLDYKIPSYKILREVITGKSSKVWVQASVRNHVLKKVVIPEAGYLGQTLEKWVPEQDRFVYENKIFLFTLSSFDENWKIVAKEVVNSIPEGLNCDTTSRGSIAPSEIVFPNVLFNLGQYDIKIEYRSQLVALSEYLKRNPKTLVHIKGHADERGSDSLNEELSKKRALSVREFLYNHGVTSDQLTIEWFGEKIPFATGSLEEQLSLNRRVEITLIILP